MRSGYCLMRLNALFECGRVPVCTEKKYLHQLVIIFPLLNSFILDLDLEAITRNLLVCCHLCGAHNELQLPH